MQRKNRFNASHWLSGATKNWSTRRQFLLGVTASATALGLAGCGGDGSSAVASSSSVERTAVTGSLTDHIRQFSVSSEQVGNIWEGQSPALANLQTFANGGNRVTRSASDSRVTIQAVWYSLTGLRSGWERLAIGLLSEDDQGQLAQTVDSMDNLSGSSSVVNPQWLAAMMLQTYSALRVTGALIKIMQIAGVKEMQTWVSSQTDNTAKMIAYAVLADSFNSWLDAIQKGVGTPSLESMKLDLSASVTPANVATQLAKIDTSLDVIPYGMGYRPGGTISGTPDDAMLTGSGASNFALSFLGALAAITLSTGTLAETFPQTVDPTTAKYSLAARLGTSGLGATITTMAGTASAAQTAADSLVTALFATGIPAADSSAANCIVQIASGAYGVVVSVAQAILSDHSLVGAAVNGNVALKMLNDEVATIKKCGTDAQLKILKSVECDILYLQGTHLIGGNTVVLRTIPITNLPSSVETDQIRDSATLFCNSMLCYPPIANAGWKGTPKDRTISIYRQILAGLTTNANAPRTFNNAEISGAGLIYDLLIRYADLLKPDTLTSGQFIFCTANFARLLRRSPGALNAKLPSITAAVLLCTAPDFAPSRSGAPVDLSTISSLTVLNAAATIVPGVPIHVQ